MKKNLFTIIILILIILVSYFKKELIHTSDSGYQTDSFYVIEGKVKPGQAISHILKDYNVSSSDIYKLDRASKDVFDVRNIQTGKGYTIICKDSNKIAKFFIYQKSKIEYVVYDLDSISVYLGEKEVTIKNNTVSGTIKKGGGLWRCLTRKL